MNRTKENINLMITTDWEKPFNKISTHSWFKKKRKKTLSKLGLEGYFTAIQVGICLKNPQVMLKHLSLDSQKSQSLHRIHYNNDDFTKFGYGIW